MNLATVEFLAKVNKNPVYTTKFLLAGSLGEHINKKIIKGL